MKRFKTVFITAALLTFVMLESGCTVALWKNDMLDTWNEPATESHVRLFQSRPPGKILVVYDEYCTRRDAMRPRAYWINEEQKQPEQQRAPHFVCASSAAGLTPIPVFRSCPDDSNQPPRYAVAAADGQSFTLYLDGTKTATHNLPSYNDGTGEVEKVLLTPVAVAGDLTIIGGVLGYFYLEGEAAGYNGSY